MGLIPLVWGCGEPTAGGGGAFEDPTTRCVGTTCEPTTIQGKLSASDSDVLWERCPDAELGSVRIESIEVLDPGPCDLPPCHAYTTDLQRDEDGRVWAAGVVENRSSPRHARGSWVARTTHDGSERDFHLGAFGAGTLAGKELPVEHLIGVREGVTFWERVTPDAREDDGGGVDHGEQLEVSRVEEDGARSTQVKWSVSGLPLYGATAARTAVGSDGSLFVAMRRPDPAGDHTLGTLAHFESDGRLSYQQTAFGRELADPAWLSLTAAADGAVFVTWMRSDPDDDNAFQNATSALPALSRLASDGSVDWTLTTPGFDQLRTTDDGTLYALVQSTPQVVGTVTVPALFALDGAGSVRWSRAMPGASFVSLELDADGEGVLLVLYHEDQATSRFSQRVYSVEPDGGCRGHLLPARQASCEGEEPCLGWTDWVVPLGKRRYAFSGNDWNGDRGVLGVLELLDAAPEEQAP